MHNYVVKPQKRLELLTLLSCIYSRLIKTEKKK
jgi:hypothetical protein